MYSLLPIDLISYMGLKTMGFISKINKDKNGEENSKQYGDNIETILLSICGI